MREGWWEWEGTQLCPPPHGIWWQLGEIKGVSNPRDRWRQIRGNHQEALSSATPQVALLTDG